MLQGRDPESFLNNGIYLPPSSPGGEMRPNASGRKPNAAKTARQEDSEGAEVNK